MMKMSLSKFLMLRQQHFKLVNSSHTKNPFNSNLRTYNSQNLSCQKTYIWELLFMFCSLAERIESFSWHYSLYIKVTI